MRRTTKRSWHLSPVPADLSPVHEPVSLRTVAERLQFGHQTVRNWALSQRGVGRYHFPEPLWKDGATLLYDWTAVWCWAVATERVLHEGVA